MMRLEHVGTKSPALTGLAGLKILNNISEVAMMAASFFDYHNIFSIYEKFIIDIATEAVKNFREEYSYFSLARKTDENGEKRGNPE
ncbi:hypothetical protein OM416_03210 [Paenibacillus sp. LS1]|nr:hypothetical protein [Paenibacillus sp. LS1]